MSLPSPYPGLRPFQLDDSEYFFGRDEQAHEVTTRLQKNRFVSIIGGSGSGKSSLVLAGAIPRLRSFAIQEAGDFWVPIITTPGTNHSDNDSPVERLARSFCLQLETLDAALNRRRIAECANLLRQQQGLKLMVERFWRKIKNSDGADLTQPSIKINFLFLIDQFEEIFHKSNATSPVADDCAHLVNRILEQFSDQHQQICVALTMRSEHLNDCPRYPNLPDAINATFYLVKRLSKDQLRQAIIQPAYYYLRNAFTEERTRARREGKIAVNWNGPDTVTIAPEVLGRLQQDSESILKQQDHSDLLPLLQHLLFWMWSSALSRCTATQPVPSEVTLEDLFAAVFPHGNIVESTNFLTTCLENRCELIFQKHPNRQEKWKNIFLGLAYKEPNTGAYTQQRAGISNLGLILDKGSDPSSALAANLSPWLRPHSYLYWDEDSGTVKVAHETLIRRWNRFCRWTDDQDRQLQRYVMLLDDYLLLQQQTQNSPRPSLLKGDSLNRYLDVGLLEALADPTQCARLEKLLSMHKESERFTHLSSQDAKALLTRSKIAAEQERENEVKKEKYKTRRNVALVASFAFLVFIITYGYSQSTLKEQARYYFSSYALPLETQKKLSQDYLPLYEMGLALSKMLQSVSIYKNGTKVNTQWLQYIPLWGEPQLQQQDHDRNLSESSIIAGLSKALNTAPWKIKLDKKDQVNLPKIETCTVMNGKVHISASLVAPDPQYKGPGLVVTRDAENTTIYMTEITNGDGALTCEQIQPQNIIYSAPNFAHPNIGLDKTNASIVKIELDQSIQFASVDWGGVNHPNTMLRFYAAILREPNKTLPIPDQTGKRYVFPIKSTQDPDNFSIYATSETSKFRIFQREPQKLASSKANPSPFSEKNTFVKATDQDLCKQLLDNDKYKSDMNQDTVGILQLTNPKNTQETFCIQVVKLKPNRSSQEHEFYAHVYLTNNETSIQYPGERKPLAKAIPLGTIAPDTYSITDSQWLQYTASNKTFTTPWTLDHWEKLSNSLISDNICVERTEESGKAEEPCLDEIHFKIKYKLPVHP